MSDADDLPEIPRVRPGGRPKGRAERQRAQERRKAPPRKPPKRDRAEYMQEYRARKTQERELAADEADEAERVAKSGINPETGEWTPAFPGQRPPWSAETAPRQYGHFNSLVTGAKSVRKTGPLAEAIKKELLSDPECPEYLKDRMWGPAIDAWAHAEAVVRLLRQFVDDIDYLDAMSEFAHEDETVQMKGSKTRRVSTGRRVASVNDQLHRHEGRAAQLRKALGLDPMARARLGKDIQKATFDLAAFLAQKGLGSEPPAELPPGEGGSEAATGE